MVLDGKMLVRMYTAPDSAPGRALVERVGRRGGDNGEWRELEAIGRDFGGPVRYAVSRPDY